MRKKEIEESKRETREIEKRESEKGGIVKEGDGNRERERKGERRERESRKERKNVDRREDDDSYQKIIKRRLRKKKEIGRI